MTTETPDPQFDVTPPKRVDLTAIEQREILEAFGDLGLRYEASLGELKDGGPPVDETAILHYVAGTLDEASKSMVAAQIFTWRAWHRTYAGIKAAASLSESKAGEIRSDA